MPISLDQIFERRNFIEKIESRPALQNAEKAILDAASDAWKRFQSDSYNFEKWTDDSLYIVPPKYKMKAAAGITFLNEQGQVLLEKTRHGTYAVFCREIEEKDFSNLKTPVTISAIVRGLNASRLQLSSEVLGRAILNRFTLMLPNKDLKTEGEGFKAQPVYLVQLSKCSDGIIKSVHESALKALGFAWADLSQIIHQEERIDADLQKAKKEFELAQGYQERGKVAEQMLEIRHRPIKVAGCVNGQKAILGVEDEQRVFGSSKEALLNCPTGV